MQLKCLLSLLLVALIGVHNMASANEAMDEGESQRPDHWLLARIKEAHSIKPGMSRADLLRVFEQTDGVEPACYVLKSCPEIYVEVHFDAAGKIIPSREHLGLNSPEGFQLMVGVHNVAGAEKNKNESEHEQWLLQRIKEAQSVKPGMSRAALLKVFEESGGFDTVPATSYFLKSCSQIGITVTFDKEGKDVASKKRAEKDKELEPAAKLESDAKLTISKMSPLYLDYSRIAMD